MKKIDSLSRRSFLKTMTAAGTAVAFSPYVVPRKAFAQGKRPGANDTVKVAVVGLGGRCLDIFPKAIQPARGVKVVGVSDMFPPRLASFLSKPNTEGVKGYDDFRKMIETEKPDGVMVITATHQRAWIAAMAMQMGAHLYIEKPMCLTIQEGRYLVDAAKKYNRVTQVGTQQRSLPLCNWASDLVKNGALGKVKVVEAPNFVGPNTWDNKPAQPFPAGMTEEIWDLWTNQAVMRPYHPELHWGWARWWDYDAGGTGFGVSGWGTHSYDQVNRVLGTDETGPVEIVLEEPCTIQDAGKYITRTIGEDETGAEYYDMVRKVVGPRARMKMLFANGVELRLNLNSDRGPGLGCIVTGEKGKMEINRHKVSSNPKELTANIPEEAKNSRDETIYHVENWVEGIRTGKKCTADIEIGQRSTTLCELVNIVRATAPVGEKIGWDPVKERFTNNDKGNEMLARPRRKGYELPELS